MTHPGAQYLAELRELAEKATPGEWFVWEGELCYRDSRGMLQRLKPSAGNAIFIAGANPQVMIKLLDHLASEKARADAAEAERDELREKLATANALVTCCCGDPVDNHSGWEGHSPVDQYHYAYHRQEATIADLTAKLQAAEAEHRFSLGLIDNAQATIASLTEQLAEAREALEPFARWKIADGLPNGLLRTPDQHPILIGTEHLVVAGDFRRARATLSRLEKQEGEA